MKEIELPQEKNKARNKYQGSKSKPTNHKTQTYSTAQK